MRNRVRQVFVCGEPQNIDFGLLQKQKRWLCGRGLGDPNVEGLLGFIDAFQDAAAKALADEGPEVVFGDKPKQKPRPVVFRVWRDKPHEVLALLMDTMATDGGDGRARCLKTGCDMMTRLVDYKNVIGMTRPATPKEYAALKSVLAEILATPTTAVKHRPTQFRNYKHKA